MSFIKTISEYWFNENLKYYVKNIKLHLRLYPEDKRKLVISNYKTHGGKVFEIFAEVNKKENK